MNFIHSKAWQSRCTGAASLLALCLCAQPGVAQTEQILFDDFSYTTTAQMANNGWRLRTWEGGPGLANGSWSTNNISFVTDPAAPANKFMRLKASTNINGSTIVNNRSTTGSVSQAEVARVEQIYKNGTWAARMYFNDAPSTGPDGDTAIETFFGLTDYIEGAEPYSEIDFEYLPNGGWWTGSATPSMWSGTYRIVDWSDESNHGVTRTQGSLQGWHTLVMQVQDGHIAFYIDGAYQTSFSGAVAPDYPMYLMFQLWISNDCFDAACNTHGYINSSSYREYFEDVDWVYFEKNNQVPATEIPQKIANLRAAGTSYVQNINGNSASSTPAASSRPSSSSRASSSAPASFTRLIQAEAYTAMSGVQLDATMDTGGGQYVGWIDANDWMAHANINFPTSGTYKVEYRVASPSGSVLSLDLNAGAIQLGQVTIPATGGWQNWTTVSHSINVTAGTYSLGIYAPQGGWNINWLRITKI
jgi:hypothetical protein